MQFCISGCTGYQVGAGSLYAPDVATVYVPMIESDSYRRDLGERLTEAVIKEIELKTPYKVVDTPDADSVLSARLSRDTRRTLVENAFDDPRLLENELHAEVTWLNRRRLPIIPMQSLAVPPDLVLISQTSNLIPEVGQSVASQQQQAIERLAQQIVSTMEGAVVTWKGDWSILAGNNPACAVIFPKWTCPHFCGSSPERMKLRLLTVRFS